ncbi:hypothetical protein HQ520_18020 [bacterium]|nr:hypothetical protein [bacterium]
MPHPLAIVQARSADRAESIGFAVIAEPSRLPFRWLGTADAQYGFSILNAAYKAQPSIFTPILGMEESNWQKDQTQTVAFRVLAYPGDWKDTLEYISGEIMGVGDYRQPVNASLTDAAFNMIDLMLDDEAGGWHDGMMSFYDIETRAMGKQAAPLAVLEASILGHDENFFAQRALPTLAFTLSTKGSAVIHTGIDREDHPFTDQLSVPTKSYGTSYWQGVSSLLGQANPWLEEFVLPGGDIIHSTGYNLSREWTERLAQYRYYQDLGKPTEEVLKKVLEGADEFIEKEIYGPQTRPIDFSSFYNIHFYPYWWDLVDLYEITGEKKYLDAAEEGAFHTMAGQWSHPPYPDRDIPIHEGGQVDSSAAHMWWKDTEEYRLGWPRQEGDTPERTVPAWQVSPIGLSLEQPSTYIKPDNCRNIMASSFAPHLLRVWEHTGRDSIRAYARNSIIGRFTNYNGYYLTLFTDLVHDPEFPYKGPDLSSIYYHHIPVHYGFTVDYLFAQAAARSQGKISFPHSTQKNYAYFMFRCYGMEPGEIYGEKGAIPWMARDLVKLDTHKVDWIAARSKNRFFLVLMNQEKEPLEVGVDLNKEKIGVVSGTARLYEGDSGISKSLADASRVTVPAQGVATLSIPIKEMEMYPTLKPLKEGHVSQSFGVWGDVHAFRIRSPFGQDGLYVAVIGPYEGDARASLELKAPQTQSLTATTFPYDFLIYPLPMDQEIRCTVRMEGPAGAGTKAADLVLGYE